MKKIFSKLLFITLNALILLLIFLIVKSAIFDKKTAEAPSAASDLTARNSETGSQSAPAAEGSDMGAQSSALSDEEIRESDIGYLMNEDYDFAFLSMFPDDEFDMGIFYHYVGVVCYKPKHIIADLPDLNEFLRSIPGQKDTVFLIIAPDIIAEQYSYDSDLISGEYALNLLDPIKAHPATTFVLTLPFYSLDYLHDLSTQQQEALLKSYNDFYKLVAHEPNVDFRFWGAFEWLIANPGNYTSYATCTEPVSERLVLLACSPNSFYRLTDENADEEFEKLRKLMKGNSSDELLVKFNPVTGICDNSLSSMDIIFFGDSLIGNYTGSNSIPGVVEGLSGAHTYNLGIGGAHTAFLPSDDDAYYLNDIVDAFLAKDTRSLEGTNAETGMKKYLDEHQKIVFRKPCFVLNFGINDYFSGVAVEYPDSAQDNLYTFKGALYSAVKKLTDAYPVSTIVINTPCFTSAFDFGTRIMGDEGETLDAYALAAHEVAESFHAYCLDNYTELGLNEENYMNYLEDGVHPSDPGHYLIGRAIIQKLTQ